MTHLRMIRTKTGTTLAAVGVAALVAACGSSAHSSNSASSGSSGSSGTPVSGTPASDKSLQVSLVSGHDGKYLAGPGGRALYLWVADGHNMSHCSGACAQAWPALLSKSKPLAGSGVKASDLGTIAHKGGEKQVTYDGHPLYYFVGDPHHGTTKGQGSNAFGAKWWLVSAAGAAITSSSSAGSSGSSGGSGSGSGAPSSTTTSSSSSASGGWG
jgi:predicted lipoprotein with Yx(FWY)xxD motif